MSDFKRSPLLLIPDNVIVEVRKEYNLDKPERRQEAIKILAEWIQKQPHFLKKDYSEQYLEILLVSCKGSVEKAKKLLDSLASMKTLLPKFFTVTHIDDLGPKSKILLESILDVALPVLTPDLYRVAVVKLLKDICEPDIFTMSYQLVMSLAEYIKTCDYATGQIVVFDAEDVNILELATTLKLVEFHQFLTIMIKCYGVRVKAVYVITDSKAINMIVKSVKPFVGEKIYDRIKIVPTGKSLANYLPKEILPIEYGGTEKSLLTLWDEWIKEVSTPEHREYMKMMNKAGTDESLRTTSEFNKEILGMPGSFRHLSLD